MRSGLRFIDVAKIPKHKNVDGERARGQKSCEPDIFHMRMRYREFHKTGRFTQVSVYVYTRRSRDHQPYDQ